MDLKLTVKGKTPELDAEIAKANKNRMAAITAVTELLGSAKNIMAIYVALDNTYKVNIWETKVQYLQEQLNKLHNFTIA